MISPRNIALALLVSAAFSLASYAGWQRVARGQAPPASTTSSTATAPPPASTTSSTTVPPPASTTASPPASTTSSTPASPDASARTRATPAAAGATHAHAPGDEQRCASCHTAQPDGRLRTHLGGGKRLTPSGPWLGMAHDRDWLVRHRWVAADRGSLCAQCHKERECTVCHDGRARPRAIHPNDWLTLHPQHARRTAADCQGCHSLQTFCTECHARLGISQLSASGSRSGTRFHPPAAQWTGSINAHGREAMRSLSTCVSCHAEQDCIRCHAAGTTSGIASPHPPGFRNHCAALAEANDRACFACHGAGLAAARALCR